MCAMKQGMKMRISTDKLLILLLGSTGLTALAAPAMARDGAPEAAAPADGAIVVTARRRLERAQDVPIALSVTSGTTLEQRGINNLLQLKQQVPSFSVLSLNPRNTNFTIRGLGSNVAVGNDGLENGVGIYVDDVYLARPGQTVFDFFDVDRIEVLRGPQGTLFGKNTTAGAVSITSRAPAFEPSLSGDVSLGNYGYAQVRAAANVPLIDDKAALRVSATLTRRDGLFHNVRTGRNLHNQNNEGIRAQLLLKPTERFSLTLSGDYGHVDQRCCFNIAAGYVTQRVDGTPLPNSFADRAARLGYTPLPADPYARRTDINSKIRVLMEQGGGSARGELDLGAAAITSITAYRFWSWKPQNDSDNSGLNVLRYASTANEQRQFSQELRLASTGDRRFSYIIGGYYFWQRIRGVTDNIYGPDAPRWVLPAATPAAVANAALDGLHLRGVAVPVTHSYAAFGQTSWKATDALTFTLGLRYTHEKKTGTYSQAPIAGVDLSTLSASVATAARALRNNVAPVSSYGARTSENNLSLTANIAYKVGRDALLYATYSRGFKSGGLNLANLGPGIGAAIDPEKVAHYEVGAKTQWLDGALTANFAGFWTEVKDYQTTLVDTDRALTYLANAGKVRSRGVEADFQARPVDALSLYASGVWLDASYVSYPNASCPVEYFGLTAIKSCDLSGRRLPGAPKWTVSGGGELRQPVGDALEAYAATDVSYRSTFNTTTNLAPSTVIRGYALVDGRIGLRDTAAGWDVSLWARNLFDKKYFGLLSQAQFNSGQITAQVGDPRTWGVTLRGKF
jgi:iron complex outermembrane receptor protein